MFPCTASHHYILVLEFIGSCFGEPGTTMSEGRGNIRVATPWRVTDWSCDLQFAVGNIFLK